MSFDLLVGGGVTLLAYLILVGLVLYNRSVLETIRRHRISNIREVKKLLQEGTPDDGPR